MYEFFLNIRNISNLKFLIDCIYNINILFRESILYIFKANSFNVNLKQSEPGLCSACRESMMSSLWLE